jgi:hypothetical protein
MTSYDPAQQLVVDAAGARAKQRKSIEEDTMSGCQSRPFFASCSIPAHGKEEE